MWHSLDTYLRAQEWKFSFLYSCWFPGRDIMDTSVGEIDLLDRVCHGCEFETADRNLVDDSYYHNYTWYVTYGHGLGCTLDDFDVWFGRRVSSLTISGSIVVLWESIGSSDLVLHCICGRSHRLCCRFFYISWKWGYLWRAPSYCCESSDAFLEDWPWLLPICSVKFI